MASKVTKASSKHSAKTKELSRLLTEAVDRLSGSQATVSRGSTVMVLAGGSLLWHFFTQIHVQGKMEYYSYALGA